MNGMTDGWRMLHDIVHLVTNRVADLQEERQHVVGPMEELGILERIEELTALQLKIQEKLSDELRETAERMREGVRYGSRPPHLCPNCGKAGGEYTVTMGCCAYCEPEADQ
jgi:hypothetical protein